MISHALQSVVLEYIRSDIELEDLEDWLAPRLHSSFDSGSSADEDLVAEIELGLAEVADGTLTEDEFRQSLLSTIQQRSTIMPVDDDTEIVTSFGSSETETTTKTFVLGLSLATQPY